MIINSNTRFVAIGCGRKKRFINAEYRRRILPKRNILKSNNIRRKFYGSKKTKKSLKNITATETIMLNNGKIETTRVMKGLGR